MELHIVSEANRCLNCKKPMCQQGCPIHTPIPQVIQLFKQNKLTEAGQILFENNPLSAICALICNHEQQCAGHCVLGKKSTPVHFSSIENYISEFAFGSQSRQMVASLKPSRRASASIPEINSDMVTVLESIPGPPMIK